MNSTNNKKNGIQKLKYSVRISTALGTGGITYLVWENILALRQESFFHVSFLPIWLEGIIVALFIAAIMTFTMEQLIKLIETNFQKFVWQGINDYFQVAQGPYETFTCVLRKIPKLKDFVYHLSIFMKDKLAGNPSVSLLNDMIDVYVSEFEKQVFVVSFETYICFLISGAKHSQQIRAINLTPPWDWWHPHCYDRDVKKVLYDYIDQLKKLKSEVNTIKRITVFEGVPNHHCIFKEFISQRLNKLNIEPMDGDIPRTAKWLYDLLHEIDFHRKFMSSIPKNRTEYEYFEKIARDSIIGITQSKLISPKTTAYHVAAKYLEKFSNELHKSADDAIYCYQDQAAAESFPVDKQLSKLLNTDKIIFDSTVVSLMSPLSNYVSVSISRDSTAASNFDKLFSELKATDSSVAKGTLLELATQLTASGGVLLQ